MRTASTAIALALLIGTTAASAQVKANPYDNGAEPFAGIGRIEAPALSSTTRAAVKAEFLRARKAGEISPYDNHADVIRMADLADKPPVRQPSLAGR